MTYVYIRTNQIPCNSHFAVLTSSAPANGTSYDLQGKKIVFFGEVKPEERKKLEEEAECYGCCPSTIISHKTDAVILAGDKGTKCPDASRLGEFPVLILTIFLWRI